LAYLSNFLAYEGRTCVTGILRIIYVCQVHNPKHLDKTWAGFNAYVAGIAEGTVGIMCACAPSLRRFLGVWFRGQMRSARSAGSAGTPKAQSSRDSTAERSVQRERDVDRYPDSVGAGADIEDVEFERKMPYVVNERVEELDMAMGLGRITTRRKDNAPQWSSFNFGAAVEKPESAEDLGDIR
jgi:hypothetical protein